MRQNAVMQAIAINLSDEDIKLLAVYLGRSKKPKGVLTTSNIDSIDLKNEGFDDEYPIIRVPTGSSAIVSPDLSQAFSDINSINEPYV